MENSIKKILNYLSQNKEISDNLFLLDEMVNDETNINLWIRKEYKKDLKNVVWIYISKIQQFNLIGTLNIKNHLYVVALDTQGEQIWLKSFQDIPYEMIRIQIQNYEDESVENYFKKYPESEKLLKEYEKWCEINNIKLDKDKIYHDKNGNLFTHYFELD